VAADDDMAGGVGILRRARGAIVQRLDEVEVARAGFQKLRDMEADIRAEEVEAEAGITSAVNCLLAPVARAALERLKILDSQRKPLLALLQLIQQGDAPVRLPPDQVVRELKLQAAIDGPLKDLRAQINQYFAAERASDMRAMMRVWSALREELRTNPNTELPPLP
jgi:hypothetical protein